MKNATKKSERVIFRLTKDEKNEIMCAFEKSGYRNFSNFFVDAVLNPVIVVRDLELMLRALDVSGKYQFEIQGIERNIKQIIRMIDEKKMRKEYWKQQVQEKIECLKNMVQLTDVYDYFDS